MKKTKLDAEHKAKPVQRCKCCVYEPEIGNDDPYEPCMCGHAIEEHSSEGACEGEAL